MKLLEKRIVSFVVAFAMLFTNCVNTYSVSVDSYEYGSLFVIGETTNKNELLSSAAEKLGAVESSYIFASLDDSLITKEVLTNFVEESKEEKASDEKEESKEEKDLDEKEESKEEKGLDEKEESKEEKASDEKEESKEEKASDEKEESKEEKGLDEKEESEEEKDLDEKEESEEEKDLDEKEESEEEKGLDEKEESKEEKDLDVKEESKEEKASEEKEESEKENLKEDKELKEKEESKADKKPELKDEAVENDAKFEADFSIENVKGFYYDDAEWLDSDEEYLDEVLAENGINGEILGYYELHSSGGAINATDDLLLNGIIKVSKYENVLVYYVNPFGEYLYKTVYDEVEGRFLVEVPVEEFSNNYGYDLMTTELKPVVNSTESNFTGNEINEDDIKYFNATFFNYDARMFNFATRSKQLAESKVLGETTPEEAAYYLANAGNTDKTEYYPDSPRANAEAATYARASTKNSLLFNFDADESAHYSEFYDAWLKNSLNSEITVNSRFNQPYLPQNTWTNQAITQGIVGSAGTGLTKEGLPDFQYTEAGLFKSDEDDTRTKVSLRSTKESGESQEEWLLHYKPNLRFPFKKDGEYYVFDSEKMYIDNVISKEEGDKIKLFEDDETAPMVNQKRGFWPFATSDSFTAYEKTTHEDSYLSDQYHFGMNLDAKFVIPEDFQVNGKDMTFEFSGDDDMWVYIDGKLALDVGGCHAAMNGSINFKTGEIVYNRVLNKPEGDDDWNSENSGDNLFMPRGKDNKVPEYDESYTEDVKWNLYGERSENNVGLNKEDFAVGSVHSIEIFYLERGTGESNCKMTFNISTVADIEAEKTAYVYDDADTTREVNTTDSMAYTGQDVFFILGVKNNSKQVLNDVIVYDKELKLLFDKNGFKKNVEINATGDELCDELSKFTISNYDYEWKDSNIKENFEKLKIDAKLEISEKGVSINDTLYGSEDVQELRKILKKKTSKDIRKNDYDENSVYVIGNCDSVIFGRDYVSDDDKVEYKVKDTMLHIRQVVEDGNTGKLLKEAQPAFVDTVSDVDKRSLYFPSNRNYVTYTSYYNNVDYTVAVVLPSDYEFVAIDVDDDEIAETDLLNSKKYNGDVNFSYEGEQYEKYVTIYLRKTENDDWHNSKAIVNEFDTIIVK